MKSHVLSVLALFGNKKRYIVPMFQRQYVWTIEKQWTPLWEDIERKVTERLRWLEKTEEAVGDEKLKLQDQRPSEHFLGAIVLDQHRFFGIEVPANLVIDGQQRLTTCQVFLSSLRDVVQSLGISEFADELRGYTLNTGLMQDPQTERYKVWPTQFDEPHFRAIIDSGSLESLAEKYPTLADNKLAGVPRLVQAYVYFSKTITSFLNREVVSDNLQSQPSVIERITALFETFNESLQVVSIELEGQDDPQVIFETLNARGEPLLPSDLLRNYFFWRANREKAPVESLYHDRWEHFDTDFWKKEEKQGRLTRPRVDIFFYNFLQLKTGAEVNVSRLYHEYKQWSEQPTRKYPQTADELGDIHRYSLELQKLMVPTPETSIGRFAQVLQIFDVKTVYPLVLKLLAEGSLTEPELGAILNDLESYLVRRQVCGLTAANYNRMFVSWVAKLSEADSVISQEHLRQIMLAEESETGVWPNDARFMQSWLNDQLYPRLKSNSRMEYILRRLEMHSRTLKHENVIINSGLTVEHVLPQQWAEFWPLRNGMRGTTPEERLLKPDPDSSERDRTLHTMGNLTLLTGSLNTAVRNHAFNVKVPQVEGYTLLAMNSYFREHLASGKPWDEGAIAERGRDLFAAAKTLWPYPGQTNEAL